MVFRLHSSYVCRQIVVHKILYETKKKKGYAFFWTDTQSSYGTFSLTLYINCVRSTHTYAMMPLTLPLFEQVI